MANGDGEASFHTTMTDSPVFPTICVRGAEMGMKTVATATATGCGGDGKTELLAI